MNHLRNLRVTVFGGTGFVGRHLIKYLCNYECIVKVPTRNPAKAYFLQPLGDVAQISAVKFDLSDNKKLTDTELEEVSNLQKLLNEHIKKREISLDH